MHPHDQSLSVIGRASTTGRRMEPIFRLAVSARQRQTVIGRASHDVWPSHVIAGQLEAIVRVSVCAMLDNKK
ncbi:hypothetical protein chiPu_0004335 [Chiloscyllium punctatum]|uniref:Uncharacterized protein n=1 Tax=Chiloscyllium punctatum TaxID=137246 RepID=A0A401S6A8_CHIPU|nr:hypothetical protein [Chiloscyllium punctatum]